MSGRRSLKPNVAAAATAAEAYDGVLSRRELRELGLDRHAVLHQVREGRWVRHGHQTIALARSPLTAEARRWRAIWEVGHRIAALDGVSALQAAELEHYVDDEVHVSIPHGSRPYPVDGVRTHRLRTRLDGEVLEAGVPRVRPALAAIRAAHWARSDRQATLILAMAVQQRLILPAHLVEASAQWSGRRRPSLVRRVVLDLLGGAQSLGELDFAALCRERGLPEPSRQVVRKGPRGRIYLDVRWEGVGLVVEIDGAQHRTGLALTADNLRQNNVTIKGDMVLRIDLLGLRLEPDAFMDQVCAAHADLSLRRSA